MICGVSAMKLPLNIELDVEHSFSHVVLGDNSNSVSNVLSTEEEGKG